MNWANVKQLIEEKCPEYISVTDYNGYQIWDAEYKDCSEMVAKMDEMLPMFKSYKRICVKAKKHKSDKSEATQKYQWHVDLSDPAATGIGGREGVGSYGGMGFTEMLNFVDKCSSEKLDTMEKMYKMQRDYDDRIRKLENTGIMDKLAPMLAPVVMKMAGFSDDLVMAAARAAMPRVAGPDVFTEKKNTTTFESSKDNENMTDDEKAAVAQMCVSKLIDLQKHFNAMQTLQYLDASLKVLEQRAKLDKPVKDLLELVEAATKDPFLIDDALAIIRKKQ